MNNKPLLTSLALAMASSVLYAQSNVEIYGVVDAGTYAPITGTAANAQPTNGSFV